MLERIIKFLGTPTPESWLKVAAQSLDVLLIDHAHCEKKAASTALSLMYRYVEYPRLLQTLSRLAREELRHFEQVLQLLKQRNITYTHLEPAGYAKHLRQQCRSYEPDRLIDLLVTSAIIEARSCERFAALCPYLPADLAEFYSSLVKAEARHYEVYLTLAQEIPSLNKQALNERIEHFITIENGLITQAEPRFRFHSGVPV